VHFEKHLSENSKIKNADLHPNPIFLVALRANNQKFISNGTATSPKTHRRT
jgi:hypothetical protein